MPSPIRSTLILAVIIGLTLGLLVLLSVWVAQVDPGLGQLPEWYRQYQEEQTKKADLIRKVRLNFQALLIKNRVTHELLQGQTSLRHAVGVFRCLCEATPLDLTNFLPGDTPEEKYGRSV